MDQPMRMVAVPDGKGGITHKMVPHAAPASKRGKPPMTPAQIEANPDSTAQQLKLFIERIERLEEDKRGIADDIRDVYAEAKAIGFDPKTMRAIVTMRRLDPNARAEQAALLDTYTSALGLDH